MYSGRRFVGSRRVKYGGTVLRPSGEPSRVLKRKKDTPRIFQSVFHLILNFDLFVSGKTGLFERIFIRVDGEFRVDRVSCLLRSNSVFLKFVFDIKLLK